MDRAAQGEDKKAEIVKRAFEQFYEGGFHATGIDAVMSETGISKRTLYKYFSSKEDLVEAVLDYYGANIAERLFVPAMKTSDDPREQLLALFDMRKTMVDQAPIRGCLGIKAAQEYAGKHEGIAAKGKAAAAYVEKCFVELCRKAGFTKPTLLGRQINILFQGAVLLSHVSGESAPFTSAKEAVLILLSQNSRAPKAKV
jgi:AcrR family transcriptional regulator